MLAELSSIAEDESCSRFILDTAATNMDARRYYIREELQDVRHIDRARNRSRCPATNAFSLCIPGELRDSFS